MKLIHLGDIHVRNNERFEEYNVVLNNTIEKIKNENADRIIVNGDVFNSGTIISPESVKYVYDFINKLSEITEVDLFFGNHDANLRSLHRMNSIDLVYYLLKDNKHVHYYRESGLYNVSDTIVYGVFALYDKEKWPIEISNKDPNKFYIAIYHGALNKVKLDNGTSLKVDTSVNIFDQYSITILSDIHKRQFLDPRTVELEINEDEIEKYKNELDFEIVGE